ncbi:unannotated protein [freshwater metagenome]|uniref:Unannotated protein n=1 Tax=freshwater metagenome TaxID=449393 RepID=A0A6J7V8C3_9ZZZZ
MKIKLKFLCLSVTRDSKFVKRIDDLDAIRTNLLVHAIGAKDIRHADGVLQIAAPDTRECIGHTKVRVLTETGNEEYLARTIMRVPIRTVIEVAIARRRMSK